MNWLLLKNSLLVAGGTTLLATGLGFLAALWLAGLPARWRTCFLAVAIMALALPPFLVTNCWLDLLGYTGAWRAWLPLNIFSLGGTIWILALLLWPIPLLAVWSAWQRLEPSQLESDMAVTGWALIRVLLLPLARPSLAPAAVLTFVLALNNFAVPAILQVKVLPAEAWVRFNTTFDTGGALSLSWPLIVGPLLLLFWFARRGSPWPHLEATVSPKLFRRQLGLAWFGPACLVTVALCCVSLGLPLLDLASARRTWTELPGALEAGQSALWNSFFLAACSATAIVVVALLAPQRRLVVFPMRVRVRKTQIDDSTERQSNPGRTCATSPDLSPVGTVEINPVFQHGVATPARGLSPARDDRRAPCLPSLPGLDRSSSREPSVETGRGYRISLRDKGLISLLGWLLWLPFLIPGVLLGIALIFLFNRPWSALLYQSAGIVVVAYVIRYLGLGWSTVAHALEMVDRDLTDVARLEGATRWQMLRHVQWPQISHSLAIAWYIVFLLCLWDVESMILVVPPGGETLALRVFNLLHYGHNAQVNALCLTLLALAVLPLLLWQVWRLSRASLSCLACTALTSLLVAGCSPGTTPGAAPLDSSLFSSVQVIGSRGVGLGQLNKPRSVAVDRRDNLYVVDMTGRVQKFSPDGEFLLSWQMPQTDLGKPKGMGRDLDGNVVVIEPHYQRVNHFTPAGKQVLQWGQRGTNAGQFMLPRAIGFDSRREAFVSEYGVVERVQRFALTPTVRLLDVFGRPGNGPGEFNRPEGLCVDTQDRVYVADSCNHRIQVFTSEGKFIRTYGRPGSGKGELSYPYDICVDSAGRQYVCEFGNSRIQVFDAQDQPLEIIGGPGAEPGRFSNPWGVVLDSAGNLYVADSQNHRVQKLVRRAQAAARRTKRKVTGNSRGLAGSARPERDMDGASTRS